MEDTEDTRDTIPSPPPSILEMIEEELRRALRAPSVPLDIRALADDQNATQRIL